MPTLVSYRNAFLLGGTCLPVWNLHHSQGGCQESCCHAVERDCSLMHVVLDSETLTLFNSSDVCIGSIGFCLPLTFFFLMESPTVVQLDFKLFM